MMPPLWDLPRNGLKTTARLPTQKQKSPALCWAFFVYSFPKVRVIAPQSYPQFGFFLRIIAPLSPYHRPPFLRIIAPPFSVSSPPLSPYHRPPYTITNIYRLAFANRSAISPWPPVNNFDSRRSAIQGKTTDQERLILRYRRRPVHMANSQSNQKRREGSSLSLTARFGKSKIKSKSVF
jgi:hypothetical protein